LFFFLKILSKPLAYPLEYPHPAELGLKAMSVLWILSDWGDTVDDAVSEEVDGVAEVDGVGAGAAGGAGVGAVAAGAAVLMQIRAEWNTLFLLIVAGLQQILKRHMKLMFGFWWDYARLWVWHCSGSSGGVIALTGFQRVSACERVRLVAISLT
jgi:hypothetical protein